MKGASPDDTSTFDSLTPLLQYAADPRLFEAAYLHLGPQLARID